MSDESSCAGMKLAHVFFFFLKVYSHPTRLGCSCINAYLLLQVCGVSSFVFNVIFNIRRETDKIPYTCNRIDRNSMG